MSHNITQHETLNNGKLQEQDYFKAVEMVFANFEKGGDKYLDKAEFTQLVGNVSGQVNYPITQNLVDKMFTMCDSKKDGRIDLQELYSACHHFYYRN